MHTPPFPRGVPEICGHVSGLPSKRKSSIFAVGFLVPLRDKHHNICDLRCLVAGNIAMRSVKTSMRCPCLGTFLFLPRHRSVAHHGGASPNEVVLAQPLQVRGFAFYVNYFFHVSPFRSAARMRLLLIVAVCRRFAEEQTRESELQSGGVTIDHLFWNVQEDAVILFVRVVQRAIRHEEEVLRCQIKCVCCGSRNFCTNLLKLDGCSPQAIVTCTNTINMNKLTVHHYTSFAIFTTVPNS